MTADESMSEEYHAAKRLKSISGAPLTPTTSTLPAGAPEAIIDVCREGDILLVVNSIANNPKPVGIRVSSHILSLTSPVFNLLLDSDAAASSSSTFPTLKHITLPTDDGDALLLLCNALHLRNERLPLRIPADLLLRYTSTAAKYSCTTAASRAAMPWLDHIYHKPQKGTIVDIPLLKVTDAAYILDDPVYFARFTSKWVCTTPIGSTSIEDLRQERSGAELLARQKDAVSALKVDLDLLIDALAEGLSSDKMHYVDYAPGNEPDVDETATAAFRGRRKTEQCTVDKERATKFLAALRDANIWPATKWSTNISSVVQSIADFNLPKYDSSEACGFCLRVEDRFVKRLGLVRETHRERLWGLCLDCYKAGGLAKGECRLEHA